MRKKRISIYTSELLKYFETRFLEGLTTIEKEEHIDLNNKIILARVVNLFYDIMEDIDDSSEVIAEYMRHNFKKQERKK